MKNALICTKDKPWDWNSPPDWAVVHVDASAFSDGDGRVRVKCPNCGDSWEDEVPE